MIVRVFLTLLITCSFAFSKIVTFENLDQKKLIVQVGTYKKLSTVKRITKELLKNRDIYIRKIKKFTVIYVVNIPYKNKKKTLHQIRQKYKDAFIQKKAYRAIKKSYQKNRVQYIPKIELLSTLYKEGLTNFNNKSYLKSYKLFKQIFMVDMKNVDVNFHLARSAFEIGKYNEAVDIYKYMLFKDPNNKQIKLELAKSYSKLNKHTQAKKFLQESYK